MEFDVVDSIDAVAPAWDELATRTRAGPFLRPGWFQAWWGAFGRGRLQVHTLSRDGTLAGVVPLCRRHTTVLSLANVHSPAFAVVAEDELALRALVEHVFDRAPLHTSLCSLEAGSPSAQELERAARSRHRQLLTVTVQRSPYIEVGQGWPEFEQGLSAKFRADLRRRRRALERLGEVEVDVRDGTEGLEGLLEEVFRIEPSGWKAKRGTAIVADSQARRFYEDVAAWAAPRGSLRLAFLRLDGQPLAVEYGLEDDRSYFFFKGGFDRAYARLAPAKLLAHAMIERAFASGLETFEFLGADEDWKQVWRPSYRQVVLQHSFRRTPVGIGWLSGLAAWRLAGRPLAKRAVQWARG